MNRFVGLVAAFLVALLFAGGVAGCDSSGDGASQSELRDTANAYVDALVAASPERACRYVAPPQGSDGQAWQQQCEQKFRRELDPPETEVPSSGEVGGVTVTGEDGLAEVTLQIEGRTFEDQLRFRFEDGTWLLVSKPQK